MIIFGTKSVTRTVGNGNFYCPYCYEAPYRHREVRRFFHLYFIPLIPLSTDGEYVECETCAGTYNVGILGVNPEQAAQDFEAKFAVAVRCVMAKVTAADGVVDDAEISMMAVIYENLVGQPITEAELREEVNLVQQEDFGIHAYLADVAHELNDQGKEAVVRGALSVAMADGDFDDSEHDMILEMARALELSQAHYRGIVNQFMDDLEQSGPPHAQQPQQPPGQQPQQPERGPSW
jgi:uncharacterized tellurite resistance protein B-like protein